MERYAFLLIYMRIFFRLCNLSITSNGSFAGNDLSPMQHGVVHFVCLRKFLFTDMLHITCNGGCGRVACWSKREEKKQKKVNVVYIDIVKVMLNMDYSNIIWL